MRTIPHLSLDGPPMPMLKLLAVEQIAKKGEKSKVGRN